MRNIFKQPIQMDEQAKQFIELMKATSDRYGLSSELLSIKLQCNARHIRTMMEMWNNNKYLNTTPTFKIVKSRNNILGDKHLYRRIDTNSSHRDKILLQGKLSKIEWILKERNDIKILGEVNNVNQMSLELLSDEELMVQAREYEKSLNKFKEEKE